MFSIQIKIVSLFIQLLNELKLGMIKIIFSLFFALICVGHLFAQQDSLSIDQFENFKAEMNNSFKDSTQSPLLKEDLLKFYALNFFEYNPAFRVNAIIIMDTTGQEFGMITSTSRRPKYRKFGTVNFKLNDEKFSIPLYQNMDLRSDSLHADYLFMPFTDLTNNEETYGGGRYLDLKIQRSDTLIIDFNLCYQPYCAYNHKYSCPIPPAENFINKSITAGVKNGYVEKK